MRSRLFYGGEYRRIEAEIKELLNSQPEFLSARTAASTRATGDAIQEILADKFQTVLGGLCKEYSADFARRAMADLAFKDADDIYHIVDVKTHRKEAGFHMPNLTSVERLAQFYEDDMNCFVVLMVGYRITGTRVTVEDVHFVPSSFYPGSALRSAHSDGDGYRLRMRIVFKWLLSIPGENGCWNSATSSSSSTPTRSARSPNASSISGR